MRIFPHMNTGPGASCPICGTKEDKPVVLIGIDGTQKGHNIEALQVHVDCLELRIALPGKIDGISDPLIYQILDEDRSGRKKEKT